MSEAGTVVKHPEAPVYVPADNITANIQQILDINKNQETQLEQYRTLLDELRAEIKSLKTTLGPLKKYESIEKDTQKFRRVFLRDPILIQQLRGKLIQMYPGKGDTSATGEETRKGANRLFDGVVEECIRFSLIQFHVIKRRMEDNRDAKRPPL